MVRNKTFNSVVDKMNSQIDKLSREQIQLKAQIEQSEAKMNINSADEELDKIDDDLIYNKIMNNQIPTELSLDYWKISQAFDEIWLGRYIDFEHKHKDAIICTMLMAIRYGIGGYCKSNNLPYYITESDDPNYYDAYPATEMIHNEITFNSKTGILESKIEHGKIAKSDMYVCTWRFGNIGNFVWYMKELLIWIYLCRLVSFNASSMINKLYIKINNLATFKKEAKRLLDPFKLLAYILADDSLKGNSTQKLSGDVNKVLNGEMGKFNMDGNIAQLISTTKFQLENLCWLFGIPITSSKNQDLSSEASFSHSTSRQIAKNHDWRMTTFLKNFGITITIEDPEMLVTQNQNADKQATGTANTENSNNERKANNASN